MAIEYFSGSDVYEQYVYSGNHLIVTEQGSIQSATSYGITGTEYPFDQGASIYGFVSGQDTGIFFVGLGSTINIGTTGVVQGGVTGIFINSGIISNYGQVFGTQQAIFIGYTDSMVANTGVITGAIGILGDDDFATGTQIVNSGTITAITYGIRLPNSSQVTNTGTIRALGGIGSIGVALATKTESAASFNNSGVVVAETAVQGGEGRDTVRNIGQLWGKVSLLGGDDLYDGRGGVISGIVDLGSGDDTAYGGDGSETLLGGDGNDSISGSGGDDILDGGEGADTLDGGTGADELRGGAGDDVYVVDESGDLVVESADEGIDTVRASLSYALTDHVENLALTGSANLNGTGNALNNVITGNSGDNILDGGAGADEMRGGAGNDIYIVDDAGDLVIENADEGVDTVRASVSYVLGANVENLVLRGTADLAGTGNAISNVIVGNSGNNVLDGGEGADELRGGAGNDLYIVDHEGDRVIEYAGEGDDTVEASVSFVLAANIEKLVLTGSGDIDGTGNAMSNVIVGNDGNNVLDGGAGADELRGGAGNDTYIVDDAVDLVIENADEGIDTVQASLSYTLIDQVENLILTGSANLGGTGNALNNVITGNSGDNTLQGGQGDDTLDGGAGENVAVFSGQKSDYTITKNSDGSWTVADKRVDHDGTDELRNIQTLKFVDGTVSLTTQPTGPIAPVVVGGSVSIQENALAYAAVANVRPAGVVGDTVTYALVLNPGAKFGIDAATGQITLLGAVNYEATTAEDPDLQTENAGTPLERKFYTLRVKASDSATGLSSDEKTVVVYVNDVNEAPTDLAFVDGTRKATIVASAQDGAVVGDLTALDPEGDVGLIYAFDTSGNGGSSGSGNAGGRFKIEDGQLKVAALTGITKTETYTVTIKVTDRNGGSGSTSTYKDFLITVNPVADVNHAATDIGFSGGQALKATVTGAGASVVLASAVDPDTAPEWRNNLYKFADTGLTTDASGLFQIDAQTGQITTTRAVVGTDAGQKTLHVVAYDGSLVGPTKDYVFTIAAADAPPPVVDPIAPVVVGGSVSIQENALAYAAVANVRPAGVVGDTVTYALVLNPGAKFGIDAATGQITLLGAVNYEATTAEDPDLQTENAGTPLERKFYTLRVKASDSATGLSSDEKTVVVYVNDVNEAPTGLAFADGTRKATIGASAQDGSVVGDLTALDPEGDVGLIYAFDTSGNGGSSGSGNAGGRFKIEDGQLKVAALTGITKTETYTVTIKVTDRNGGSGSTSTYKDFLITVNPVADVNHAATDIGFSGGQALKATVTGAGASVVLASAVDPDTAPEWRNNLYKFADTGLTTDASGLFQIDAQTGQITTTRAVVGTDAGQKTLHVVAYDGSLVGPTKDYVFTIAAADAPVNHVPAPVLSSSTVRELAEEGATVGTLSATDSDGDKLTYTLVGDGAGGRFALQENSIVVANGYKLDHEQAISHDITILASDGKGGISQQTLTIGVSDWSPESTNGSVFDDIFKGDAGDDILRGNLGNDALYGGLGKDQLFGDAGNDTIYGGAGNDLLTGGSGKDIFAFDTKLGKTNVDKIVDYGVKDDSVWLDNAIFKKLGKGTSLKPGKLKKEFFTFGDKAQDANDYLIYDPAKKALYYDADGNGAGKAVAIFKTTKVVKFNHKEFFIV